MKVCIDSYYIMGGLHLFCEDYACHGPNPLPHILISDGCSSSSDTDIGARLLVLTARRRLAILQRHDLTAEQVVDQHWRFGHQVAALGALRAERLGLKVTVLDATLLAGYYDADAVYVHLYGDGCVIAGRVDGSCEIIHIDYAQNAPFYLSYLTDTERQHSYLAMLGQANCAQAVHRYYLPPGMLQGLANGVTAVTAETQQRPYDAPLIFQFRWTDYNWVALASDGLHSFFTEANSKRVVLPLVVRQLLAFTHTEEDFVKRHVRQSLIAYAKQGIRPLDDVSLGVFMKSVEMDIDGPTLRVPANPPPDTA